MPIVSLITPRPYSTYRVKNLMELSAQAVDADGSIASVEFLADGEVIGSGSISKGLLYEMAWRPNRAGTYRIQARATDNSGAVSYSRPAIIYVVVGLSN